MKREDERAGEADGHRRRIKEKEEARIGVNRRDEGRAIGIRLSKNVS